MMEINETVDRLTKWIIIWDLSFPSIKLFGKKPFLTVLLKKVYFNFLT